jgi:hypothetical protein
MELFTAAGLAPTSMRAHSRSAGSHNNSSPPRKWRTRLAKEKSTTILFAEGGPF